MYRMFGLAKGEQTESALKDALETQRRMTFLAEASKVLMGSLDYKIIFNSLAGLVVPTVADYCVLYGVDAPVHSLVRMAHAHVNAEREELLGELLADTVSLAIPTTLTNAAWTGEPTLYEDDAQSCNGIFIHEQNAERIATLLNSRWAMVLPLQARGNKLGILVAGISDSGRSYAAADVSFAEELASRASLSIDSARVIADTQESNRLKEEFLATLSHELRTPLTAILGYARLLLGGKLDENAGRQAIQSIHRNAQLQNQLISDLLDISRIVTGKLHLEMRRVALNDVVETTLDSAKLDAEAKAQTLHFCQDPLDPIIMGDPDRLQQVVGNLLSNAIKFTPAGGRVEVRVRSDAALVEISVTDNGAGVNPEFLPHVFDKFRQADISDTRQNRGLGLGLAIVRHLVEKHAGSVEAESRGIGQGATFTVRLPMQAAARRAG